MTKKYVLAGTISAFLAAANIAQAPVLDTFPSKSVAYETRKDLVRSVLSEELRAEVEKKEAEVNIKFKEVQISNRDEIYGYILRAYKDIEVPDYITPKFVRTQVWAESNDYAKAIGKAGERGLMQIMPDTWKKLELKLNFKKNAFNPEKNIYAGVKHLLSIDRQLRKRNSRWEKLNEEEKIRLLAATYNCGIGGIMKAKYNLKRVPESTKAYVRHIEKLMSGKYKEY